MYHGKEMCNTLNLANRVLDFRAAVSKLGHFAAKGHLQDTSSFLLGYKDQQNNKLSNWSTHRRSWISEAILEAITNKNISFGLNMNAPRLCTLRLFTLRLFTLRLCTLRLCTPVIRSDHRGDNGLPTAGKEPVIGLKLWHLSTEETARGRVPSPAGGQG